MTRGDDRLTTYIGNCLDILLTLPEDSIDCIVTSPPYWGLRDYGVKGQFGLEPTLDEHLSIMVRVFSELKRVLKPSGTCWVNYGDCYATTPNGRTAAEVKALRNDDRTFRDKPFSTIGGVLKPKDLCMVPNRFAIALQESGWWVRSEIIWAKPNPMPESIRDRPATSHEKIFLFTKSARYFYDAAAVRQNKNANKESSDPCPDSSLSGTSNGDRKTTIKKLAIPTEWAQHTGVHGSFHKDGRQQKKRIRGKQPGNTEHQGFNEKWDHISKKKQCAYGRNLRNYEPAPVQTWIMATRPFSEAHFATFPPELAERCILAGCPKGGIVLDPFGGAGTTALAALRHNRRAILIELKAEYMEIARARIEKEWHISRPVQPTENLGPLFMERRAS